MLEKTKEYDDNEKLADEVLTKCHEYWLMYIKLCHEQHVDTPAVVWVQNNDTNHMMVFTRGEHAEDMKEFIDNLR